MRTITKYLFLAVLLSLLMAACGPAPEHVLGYPVISVENDATGATWYEIYGDAYTGKLYVSADADNSQFLRTAGAAGEQELANFKLAFQAEMAMEGMDSGLVKDATLLGEKAVITPRIGVPLDYALQVGQLTAADFTEVYGKGLSEYMKVYDNLGIVLEDVSYSQLTWKADNRSVFIVDVHGAYLRSELPSDSLLATREGYQAHVMASLDNDASFFTKSIAPTAIAAAATVVYDAAPDYPKQGDLAEGEVFRNTRLYRTSNPEMFCFKHCGDGLDSSLVLFDSDGQLLFAKQVLGQDPLKMEEATRSAVKTAGFSESKVYSFVLDGNTFITSPDMGLPWDYYWSIHPWDENIANQLAESLVNNTLALGDQGVIYKSDYGVHQAVVSESLQAYPVDYFSVEFVPAGTYGSFGSREAYENWLRPKAYDFTVSSSAIAVATIIPPAVVQPEVVVPNEPLVTRLVESSVDGKVYPVELTESQWQKVFAGGEEALQLLSSKGLPMPALSTAEKSLKFVGKFVGEGLKIVGIAAAIYVVTDTVTADLGIQDAYQVGWLEFQPSVVPVDYNTITTESGKATYEQFATDWYQTAMYFNYYDIKSLQIRYASLYEFGTTYCNNFTLNDPSVVGVPGVLIDNDVITPWFQCGSSSGEIFFGNMITGERSVWQMISVNGVDQWQLIEGTQCLKPSFVVIKRVSGETMETQFEMCTSVDGISFKPTLFK